MFFRTENHPLVRGFSKIPKKGFNLKFSNLKTQNQRNTNFSKIFFCFVAGIFF